MDAGYTFAYLARRLSDNSSITRYRAQQTTEIIEESLYIWKDKQARKFAITIDEPQRLAHEPLSRVLRSIYECLADLERRGQQFDVEANHIMSSQQSVHEDCAKIGKILDQARRHTEDCLDQANGSINQSKSISSRLISLGQPPV